MDQNVCIGLRWCHETFGNDSCSGSGEINEKLKNYSRLLHNTFPKKRRILRYVNFSLRIRIFLRKDIFV